MSNGVSSLIIAACVCGALGVYLLLPRGRTRSGPIALVLCFLAMFSLWGVWWKTAAAESWSAHIVFTMVATMTVAGGVRTVTHHNPVLSALWFAVTVIGTAVLMFIQNATFLAVAMVTVYAGAIIVMFLFVIMLAQQTGIAPHNRISREPELATGTCFILLCVLGFAVSNTYGGEAPVLTPDASMVTVSDISRIPSANSNVPQTAALGRALFAEHWISLEVAGTLLLVALVGAIVISARQSTSQPDVPIEPTRNK